MSVPGINVDNVVRNGQAGENHGSKVTTVYRTIVSAINTNTATPMLWLSPRTKITSPERKRRRESWRSSGIALRTPSRCHWYARIARRCRSQASAESFPADAGRYVSTHPFASTALSALTRVRVKLMNHKKLTESEEVLGWKGGGADVDDSFRRAW